MSNQYTNEMVLAGAMPPKAPTLAAIESDRAIQEVQAQVIMAQRFPRDETAAQTRIVQACKRQMLAEKAMYAFPRGTSTVRGPSIRLAEVLAQHWRNLDYGVRELSRTDGESVAEAFCWDLETNVKRRLIFTVPHEMKASGKIKKLADPRDIYEYVANLGARRLRACILGIIPGDVVEAAIDQCEATLKGDGKVPLIDRVKKIVVAFGEIGVNQRAIEKKLGHKIDVVNETEFVRLYQMYRSIKDEAANREDFFELEAPVNEEATARILGEPKVES